VRKFLISSLEQGDHVTFPGPRTGDIRYMSGSQLLPTSDSPSWFMPRLKKIKCKNKTIPKNYFKIIILMAHFMGDHIDRLEIIALVYGTTILGMAHTGNPGQSW
jgi:hypothetical protein